MEKEYILVMDSGVGGLWTLEKLKECLPNENFLYFMDKLHAPYGNKSKKKLWQIVNANLRKLIRIFKIKLVVLACNTISSLLFDDLKETYFYLPIIKIDPYVEPSFFDSKSTLVLATKNTIKHNKNLQKYKTNKDVFLKGYGTLAKKIDNACGNYQKLQTYLNKSLKIYQSRKIYNVVLGCTHYNFIKQQISNIFGDVKFFENSDKVAIDAKNMLRATNKQCKNRHGGNVLVLYKI